MLYNKLPCGHEVTGDTCPVCVGPKGKSKFRNKPVKCEEHGYFHSTGEYKRWLELVMLEKNGNIYNLDRQVNFWIESIKQFVVWDFTYMEVVDGQEIKKAEDFKGCSTREYRHKRKWFLVDFPQWTFNESKARSFKNRKAYYKKSSRRRPNSSDS